MFDLLQLAGAQTLGKGRDLLAAGGLSNVSRETAAGTVVYSGRVTDSFNFVDHPGMTVSADESELLSFRCDCPEGRRAKRFCEHCAALALKVYGDVFAAQTDHAAIPAENAADAAVVADAEARPTIPEADMPISEISYSFCNSQEDLYPYDDAPQIPLERFQLVYGKNAISQMMFETQGEWGGNCYGVSTTAAMFFVDENDVDVQDFSEKAKHAQDLTIYSMQRSWRMTLLDFIEAMQISQFSFESCLKKQQTFERPLPAVLKEIVDETNRFSATHSDPIVLSIHGEIGGHAILPYAYRDLSSREGVVYIYDPNSPGKTKYMYLTKDHEGNFTDWSYEIQSYPDPVIYQVANQSEVGYSMFKRYQGDWDDRGSVTPIQAMFKVCRGAYVTDGAGAPVVRVGKDQIEIFREDVVQCRFDRANKPDEPVLFWMLPGTYHVVLEDPEVASLRVKLAQRDQFLTLETEAREAELTVSDAEEKNCALVCEAEKPYEIRMVSSLEHAYKEVSLTGVTGENGLSFAQTHGVLYGNGVEESAELYLDGRRMPVQLIQPMEQPVEAPLTEPEQPAQQTLPNMVLTVDAVQPDEPDADADGEPEA